MELKDGDSQSQSQFEPVATATEPTKDNSQSHAEPSERREEEEEDQEEGVTGSMGEEGVEEARQGAEQEDQSDMEEELVSPVLDLDPSLDMDLMTSSHLSSPSPPPLSRRGKGRSLRPLPSSSGPSDDLSIRLRQSPFSTEASPETSPTRAPITPPPLSPLSPLLQCSPLARESPPLSKVTLTGDNRSRGFSDFCFHFLVTDLCLYIFLSQPQAPPTTVLPYTPKIGMGKPAISKRKFSPGRARVKQVGDL